MHVKPQLFSRTSQCPHHFLLLTLGQGGQTKPVSPITSPESWRPRLFFQHTTHTRGSTYHSHDFSGSSESPSVRPSGRIVNVLAIQGDHFQSRRPTMIPVFGRVISIESPKPWPESDVAFEHSSTASDNLERHVLALHVLQNSFWDTWKSRTPPFFPGAPFPSAFRFFATLLGVSLWGFPFPFFREHSLRECPTPEQLKHLPLFGSRVACTNSPESSRVQPFSVIQYRQVAFFLGLTVSGHSPVVGFVESQVVDSPGHLNSQPLQQLSQPKRLLLRH